MPLSWNLGTLTSWNPLDPSGPVTGLLYLYLYIYWSTYTISNTRNTILDKLIVLPLVNRYPVFYGTRRLIAVFTTALHFSLHRSTTPSTVSLRHILILYCHLLPGRQNNFSSGFPHHNPVTFFAPPPHTFHMPRPSQPPWFFKPNSNWSAVEIIKFLVT